MEVLDLSIPKRKTEVESHNLREDMDQPLDMRVQVPGYASTSRTMKDTCLPADGPPAYHMISTVYAPVKYETFPSPQQASSIPPYYKLSTTLEEEQTEEGPAFPPKVYRGHPSSVFERLRKNKEYLLFRNQELTPFLKPPPPRNRKPVGHSTSTEEDENKETQKDVSSEYIEKRKKNNEAAKKSRDRRRQYEDELAVAAMFLEKEHMTLKVEREYLIKRAKSLESRMTAQRHCIQPLGNLPHYNYLTPSMLGLSAASAAFDCVGSRRFTF